jgi:sigma-B regulation protein RsbU (phosphoserine phosphatase)
MTNLASDALAMVAMLVAIVVIVVFGYALARTGKAKIFKSDGGMDYRTSILIIVVFGFLSVLSSYYLSGDYGTAKISVRNLPAMLAGLIGGPVAGVGAGLIGGLARFASGGASALPCMIATIIAGLIGGLVWKFSGNKYPKIVVAVLSMVASEIIHMVLVAFMSTSNGMDIAANIWPPILIMCAFGIVVFSYVYDKYMRSEMES